MDKAPTMEYRFLGPCGMKVSVLGFGTWLNYHDLNSNSVKILESCIQASLKAGINFFDTAEMYGGGIAEDLLGTCLQNLKIPRKDFVLQTKLFKCMPGVNSNFLSRKHLIEGLDASLERLKLDHVDVVLCHRYDEYTPIEEVCRGMNHLIESGKTFYWGTSQWEAEEIMEAFDCCDRLGLIKPIVEQPEYSMLVRKNVEQKLCKLFAKKKYGTTVFAPLAGGLLTGKYNEGVAPENSRFDKKSRPSDNWTKLIKSHKRDETLRKLRGLGELAKRQGVTQSELALAWVIKNTDVASAVFGATKPEQVEQNVRALSLCERWTCEIEEEAEAVLKNQPKPRMDWRKWGPGVPRRDVAVQN
eukprot:TRINITY_DN2256_c0_g1_i1.p1 TRINITY_DN2256_c0_g1~~TRINITY_DN2256_c0_g1_i1.p1  ORF type:complete len:357 (+),score=51.49 TRINITY_DN2256_c0_g1_i1:76-1146(+)